METKVNGKGTAPVEGGYAWVFPDDDPALELLESRRPVRKRSEQAPSKSGATSWEEPRLSFDDMLYFFDVNVWHRRCVLVRAKLVGGLGWRLERDGEVIFDPKNGIATKPEHPVVQLLRRPNPDTLDTFDVIVHRLLVDFYSLGNAYLEVARDRSSRVAELYHMPGRTMRRSRDLKGYWQVKEGRQIPFDRFGAEGANNEVLHFMQYDPSNDYYGVPDWYAALGTMALDRTILEFNTRLFANSLMANTALIVEGGRLSPETREAIRTRPG